MNVGIGNEERFLVQCMSSVDHLSVMVYYPAASVLDFSITNYGIFRDKDNSFPHHRPQIAHCKQYSIYVVLQKHLAKPHFYPWLLISTEYFQNRILKCSVWNYDILERSTVLQSMQPFSCLLREQHIFQMELWNFSISGYSYFHIRIKRWSLEFVISLSKVYNWSLGMRFG